MSFRVRSYIVSPKALVLVIVGAGVLGMLVQQVYSNPYSTAIPPLLICGGIVGWGVRNEAEFHAPITVSDRGLVISYVLVAAGVLVAYASTGFHRPFDLPVLLLLLYVVTLACVFMLERADVAVALVALTGVLHRGFVYYSSSVQVGLDPLFHTSVAAAIRDTAQLTPLAYSKYWYAPFFHLLTAATSGGLGVSVRDAAFLTTIIATVVPVVTIAIVLGRIWQPHVGALGAFLFVASRLSVEQTANTGPESLGITLFVLLLALAISYLEYGTDSRSTLFAFGVTLLVLVFTHQFSLFVAALAISVYTGVQVLWRGRPGRREITLWGLLVSAVAFQTSITKYDGPAGGGEPFLVEVAGGILTDLTTSVSRGGRVESLPHLRDVTLSGADSSGLPLVLSLAILYGFAVAGAIYWISQDREFHVRTGLGLGVVVTTLSAIGLGTPLLGMNALLPGRWFLYLVPLLAIFAAPGVAMTASAGARLLSGRRASRGSVVLSVALVLALPYLLFAIGSVATSVDGPYFDDAPGAARAATNATEADLYRFLDQHGPGEELPARGAENPYDDSRTNIVADHVAKQVISRHYHQPAVYYKTHVGDSGPAYETNALLVHRAYARTPHVSYDIEYLDEEYRVFGPLPTPKHPQIVYSNGPDRVLFVNQSSSD
ncbi:hypothetical protein ACFR9U_05575 [Halorientalis brevis]|uniref:Glycosyltransferase RgtA/B/C/D-like domain-containing protein n=1 Tax=Halorientalis brevis TaxID=1126241 RepID=A0ABD6C824_9EURY|nr:hypothetical protein [Halorientalis brevis]